MTDTTAVKPGSKECPRKSTRFVNKRHEAVPVGWITQPYPGVKWSFSFHEPKALPEGWIARPLYAHPPQPSETVAAAALTDLRYLANELSWDRRTRDISDRIIAALRALKGEEA